MSEEKLADRVAETAQERTSALDSLKAALRTIRANCLSGSRDRTLVEQSQITALKGKVIEAHEAYKKALGDQASLAPLRQQVAKFVQDGAHVSTDVDVKAKWDAAVAALRAIDPDSCLGRPATKVSAPSPVIRTLELVDNMPKVTPRDH